MKQVQHISIPLRKAIQIIKNKRTMNEQQRLLAEQIISAQYSYDSPTQKAELVRAFIDGVTAERNNTKAYAATVTPYEGGSAYVRGWQAALGEIFKELKKTELITVCPPNVLEHLLDLLNSLAEQPHIKRMLDD